ncbi:MAG: hypothetical protein IKJ77_04265 [Firmicutes bacterium]|nr:hypothetical protein [Bacillota bacterium]
MLFEHTYETRYGDYKTPETIKPAVILDMIQDIATKHSDKCGYGIFVMEDLKQAWLLQGIKAHFEKPIKAHSPVTIKTAVKSMRGTTSPRCSYIEQDGEVVAMTIANWFLMDVEKQKPCRIPKEMGEAYDFHDFDEEFFTYKKAPVMEAPALYEVRIGNKEIDTNMHLNNQKSAELLMDALPFDYFFIDMNVFYKQSAYLGDVLELCMTEIENGYYVHLQTKDGDVCVAGTFENL